MKNIFLFIRRFFVFICFILLQVFCIILLSNSSKTHQAFFAASANEVTGKIDKQYSGARNYLDLKKENDRLQQENARLLNRLKSDFEAPDSTKKIVVDTLLKDTLNRYRKYTFLPAKVVGNTVTSPSNYIMLERGSKQGVKKGMSVISPQGIVGVVAEVSENYCKVMSLLHRNTRVSAILKKNNSSGDVEWDGVDPHFVLMRKVSKSAQVAKGDTVLTSTYSTYPGFIAVGTVAEIKQDAATSFILLKIKTATDFFSIQHVYIVENVRYEEQTTLANKKDLRNIE
ncbi:MAG: rod shape-determining protein MreC [Chitinophagaceae bacterium]|nr:rod shape-determining protein MreC [Chitinophagaceae bacterium]